jgi:hypothetical protein
MRTRQVHLADDSTVFALRQRKNGCTLRQLAAALDYPANMAATLSDVLRRKPGALTQMGEDDLRRRLGLPIETPYSLSPCPSCGGGHGLRRIPDCHGAPVAAVVALAPGERIARSRPEPPAWVRMAAAFLAQREAARRV